MPNMASTPQIVNRVLRSWRGCWGQCIGMNEWNSRTSSWLDYILPASAAGQIKWEMFPHQPCCLGCVCVWKRSGFLMWREIQEGWYNDVLLVLLSTAVRRAADDDIIPWNACKSLCISENVKPGPPHVIKARKNLLKSRKLHCPWWAIQLCLSLPPPWHPFLQNNPSSSGLSPLSSSLFQTSSLPPSEYLARTASLCDITEPN